MLMDTGEIRRQYKYAKDKKKCISILAELNACGTDRIIEIIHAGSEKESASGKAPVEWSPSPEQKVLMDRLDELDAMIKPLEDEYRRTAEKLLRIGKDGY